MDNPNQVFDDQHRGLTVGVLLGVTVIAFEALAVVTVAPQIAGALSGMALYGWIFSAFLLASLLGITVGGQQADRRGPGLPFLVGVVPFWSWAAHQRLCADDGVSHFGQGGAGARQRRTRDLFLSCH